MGLKVARFFYRATVRLAESEPTAGFEPLRYSLSPEDSAQRRPVGLKVEAPEADRAEFLAAASELVAVESTSRRRVPPGQRSCRRPRARCRPGAPRPRPGTGRGSVCWPDLDRGWAERPPAGRGPPCRRALSRRPGGGAGGG